MEIRESKQGGFVILEPVGRIDTRTAPELEKKVAELLAAGERKFVVDLAETDYISSIGLRVLLMLAKKTQGEGSLGLASMSDHIRQVFDIAGFSGVFTIAATPAEAIAKVSATSQDSELSKLAASLLLPSWGRPGSTATPAAVTGAEAPPTAAIAGLAADLLASPAERAAQSAGAAPSHAAQSTPGTAAGPAGPSAADASARAEDDGETGLRGTLLRLWQTVLGFFRKG